jgi:hypothetical protein
VCFVVHKTTLKLECAILATLYLAGAKSTNSWCTRKGDLQRAFPLDVPMVHSPMLAISVGGERRTCGFFFLGETICLGSFEFIADYFGGLSFSPRRNN